MYISIKQNIILKPIYSVLHYEESKKIFQLLLYKTKQKNDNFNNTFIPK